MNFTIDYNQAISLYFVVVRLSVFILANPIFRFLPQTTPIRLFLIILLSMTLVSQRTIDGLPLQSTGAALAFGTIAEVVHGAVLGFGFQCAFAATAVAGKVFDVQSGLGMGTALDPTTRAQSPLTASILQMAAVTTFFAVEGHQAILKALSLTIDTVPPGTGFELLSVAGIVGQFGLSFSLGLALVAPVMAGLLLVDAALSVASRLLPQMNIFLISAPLKTGVGLLLLAVFSEFMGTTLNQIFEATFAFWADVGGGHV